MAVKLRLLTALVDIITVITTCQNLFASYAEYTDARTLRHQDISALVHGHFRTTAECRWDSAPTGDDLTAEGQAYGVRNSPNIDL